MGLDFESIRRAAYKNLHLVFIRYIGPGTYRVVESEEDGGVPVLVDYVSFHHHESRIRVKDVGGNVIYLITPSRYRSSYLDMLVQNDPSLEGRLRRWFPFLWGEESAENMSRFESILRQLEELADIHEGPSGQV